MPSLNDRVRKLENELATLKSKNQDLENRLKKYKKPHAMHGGSGYNAYGIAHSSKDGFIGPLLPWNNNDVNKRAVGTAIDTPEEAYNEHSHSEWSGGALDINTVEFVEYDFEEAQYNQNKHSQGLWSQKPPIKKSQKPTGENVQKKGPIDLVFNPKTGKWGAIATGIDVENTYLVKYDSDGNIETDENENDKKSPLYNSDPHKSSVVWDKNAQVWRFYATFADIDLNEEEEE